MRRWAFLCMMAQLLIILNDPPYGTERSYNGLRLAGSLARQDEARVGCS